MDLESFWACEQGAKAKPVETPTTELGNEKVEEIRSLKVETNESLLREEIMWNQRSKALWIKWGDRNTKFFHATVS